jgi:hypothetical protein
MNARFGRMPENPKVAQPGGRYVEFGGNPPINPENNAGVLLGFRKRPCFKD